MHIVYLITNKINGNRYVGITRYSIEKRWKEHVYSANSGKKSYLYNALRKYGSSNFYICQVASCISDPSKVEKDVIKSLNPEYNMTNGGEATSKRSMSPEVREKIRLANLGLKRSDEVKQKLSLLWRNKIKSDNEYYSKLCIQLESTRKNRYLWESKRLESIKQAAKDGKMSRQLSKEQIDKQVANMSTFEARKKMAESKYQPVQCINTGEIYKSVSEAAHKTGFSISGISKVCLGKRNKIYGLRFKFI